MNTNTQKKIVGLVVVSAALCASVHAADPAPAAGVAEMEKIGTALGQVMGAGLLIWGVFFGVRKAKEMGDASSSDSSYEAKWKADYLREAHARGDCEDDGDANWHYMNAHGYFEDTDHNREIGPVGPDESDADDRRNYF